MVCKLNWDRVTGYIQRMNDKFVSFATCHNHLNTIKNLNSFFYHVYYEQLNGNIKMNKPHFIRYYTLLREVI